MKKTALFLSILISVFAFGACNPFGVVGSGEEITSTFDESDFHGLDLNVSASVKVLMGSEYRVEVTCEESVMPHVETSVENGILKICFDRVVWDVDNMKITVTAPAWDYFDVSGSGSVKVPDTISGEKLHLDVSGSGAIKINEANFETAFLSVSGSGTIELAGSSDDLNADISGSGDLDGLDFLVKTAHLDISGSGNMRVNVSEKLNAQISGSGDIEYQGDPQLNVDISGSGKIRKI